MANHLNDRPKCGMPRAIYALLLLPAILATGCQNTQVEGGLRRTKVYTSVISLSPSVSEILANNAERRILKGGTASDNWPTGLNLPVMASVKPEFEKIAAASPDLIVYDDSLYGADQVAKLKSLGVETFVIDAKTVNDFTDQLYRIGSLLGCETNMSSYIERIRTSQKSAEGSPITPAPKVAIMLAGGGGSEHMIYGTKGFIADVVRIAGGTMVGPESDRFEKVSSEFLVGQNPDMIVVGVPADKEHAAIAAGQLSAIQNDPRFASVKAVKAGLVVPINQDVMVRRGGRVEKLIDGLHQLFGKVASKGAGK